MTDADDQLPVTREHFAPLALIAVKRNGPYQESAGAAWSALWELVGQTGQAPNVRRAIGFGLDDPFNTPPELIRYVASVQLADGVARPENEGWMHLDFPAGDFIVHRMVGPYHLMPQRFADLRAQVETVMGLEIESSRPFLEIYLSDPGATPPEELETDLCIPVT